MMNNNSASFKNGMWGYDLVLAKVDTRFFIYQKRRLVRSSRPLELYHFKYIQPSLIVVLCEEKLALNGYRSLIYLLLLNFHPQVGSCIFSQSTFTYFGLRFSK